MGAYTGAMLTCGLIILSSFLAQAGDPLKADYSDLKEQLVVIEFPPDAPLPPGWTEHRRSGRLDRVTPRPRNAGEYMFTITWDEPWAPPVTDTLNDTVRDASKRLFKPMILLETNEERVERIKRGWREQGFELVGPDPLDPLGWIQAEEVRAAERAQEMARANMAAASPPETVDTAAEVPSTETQEREPAGWLHMRGPQLLIGLTALVLAGALVKTLVL